ncbi:MAG: hypothetical protein HQ522_06150 [Bacteroidetes bacterium]|nr:hypothetical protein [Bacteroidota bacterium]
MRNQFIQYFIISLLFFSTGILSAQTVDLSKSTILASSTIKSPVRETAIKVLQEEVAKRTALNLQSGSDWGKAITIALATINDDEISGEQVPKRSGKNLPELKEEGYRLLHENKDGKEILWIIGADNRAVIFGIGKLLRTASLSYKKFILNESIDFATSPMQSIRGHQIGYRNTANSWDAWTLEQYDQYIRELVIFGTNAIENIPFVAKDESPHFKIDPQEMEVNMSNICASYGIDYWVWTPASFDLTDQEKRVEALQKHEAFYKACPQLNDIFFPGGDPGHNHPSLVLPFLKDLQKKLVKYHPEAGIWISLQGFSAEQIDYFYTYLEENDPDWLRGVVSGPSSPSISGTRHRLPAKYKHRHYPDVTHNVRCDYPVVNWDQAFMLTIGREGINPMPNYYSKIHAQYAPFTDGFVSYSDGCHDDVNKVIWSMRGWDLESEPRDIMIDYCRYHFGADLAEKAANGIFGLENNWNGPIKENGGIETTFEFWKELETENPQLSKNWRWQMLVLRAYYDTYQRRRKIYETDLEKEANKILATATEIGSEKAMKKALAKVNEADTKPVAQNLYAKILEYSDALFESIGLQTDVERYQASNSQRGCILQFVNYPLNNRWWLEDEFNTVAEMETEEEKLERLEVIRTWENPAPGSYYDNVSNIETGKRVSTTSYDACDVAWREGGTTRKRLSSQLFQASPVIDYEYLDFNGRYRIRCSGRGDCLLRVDEKRLEPIAYDKEIGGFKEFVVPMELTQDGKIRVTFDIPEESHIRWSSQSAISDVWVIKK